MLYLALLSLEGKLFLMAADGDWQLRRWWSGVRAGYLDIVGFAELEALGPLDVVVDEEDDGEGQDEVE
jgi:hypothetical protein